MPQEKKKFKLKSWKEIQEDNKKGMDKLQKDMKRNWVKFIDGVNEFFGTAPDKNASATEEDVKSIHKIQEIDLSDEEPGVALTLANKPPEFSDIVEYQPPEKKPNFVEQWDEAWKNLSENTMVAFDDMRRKITVWNVKNVEKMQDQLKTNEANWKIWLKKQEILKKNRQEKQKLAIERFNAWAVENSERNKRFFEEQKIEWDSQLKKWKTEQSEMKEKNREKWEKNQHKFKNDYEKWINDRRDKALEKSKYKLRVGWRQSLYMMMTLLPVIVVVILVLALVNKFI